MGGGVWVVPLLHVGACAFGAPAAKASPERVRSVLRPCKLPRSLCGRCSGRANSGGSLCGRSSERASFAGACAFGERYDQVGPARRAAPIWRTGPKMGIEARRKDFAYSRLAHPAWVAAVGGKVKDEDLIRNRRGKGAGKEE